MAQLEGLWKKLECAVSPCGRRPGLPGRCAASVLGRLICIGKRGLRYSKFSGQVILVSSRDSQDFVRTASVGLRGPLFGAFPTEAALCQTRAARRRTGRAEHAAMVSASHLPSDTHQARF